MTIVAAGPGVVEVHLANRMQHEMPVMAPELPDPPLTPGRQTCSTSENASRSLASCSPDRFVEINDAPVVPNRSSTLSGTAFDDITNSADVPGATFSRTSLMNPSSIPTSAIDPESAPNVAPTANPSNGTKKINPNNSPQKLPPNAPAPLMS
jgi:hypothetical protein